MTQRYAGARLHQRRRLLALGRRDQVDGAELVVFAPAAPVRQLPHPPVELLLGRRSVVRFGSAPVRTILPLRSLGLLATVRHERSVALLLWLRPVGCPDCKRNGCRDNRAAR